MQKKHRSFVIVPKDSRNDHKRSVLFLTLQAILEREQLSNKQSLRWPALTRLSRLQQHKAVGKGVTTRGITGVFETKQANKVSISMQMIILFAKGFLFQCSPTSKGWCYSTAWRIDTATRMGKGQKNGKAPLVTLQVLRCCSLDLTPLSLGVHYEYTRNL